MTDEKKDKVRVREMTMGEIVVGKWVASSSPTVEVFEPLATQPPADVAGDARKVEAWLKEQGQEGDFSMIRGYQLNIRIGKRTTVVSSLIKPA